MTTPGTGWHDRIMKTCLKCGKTMDEELFPLDPKRKDGRHPYCKSCKAEEQRGRNHIETEARRRLPKRCRRCGRSEPEISFPSRQSHNCWDCHEHEAETSREAQNRRSAKRYSEHRVRINQRLRERATARKLELLRLCGGRCVGCGLEVGEEWPGACFDFHHPEKNKEGVIAQMMHSWKSMHGRLLIEIKKCVVLCANCHRKAHFLEKGK